MYSKHNVCGLEVVYCTKVSVMYIFYCTYKCVHVCVCMWECKWEERGVSDLLSI